MNSKVSIILPIYNIKEEYLVKCTKSLMNQTEKNIEIILVDDGSSNNAYEICQRLAAEDDRIKVIRQKNSGVSVARNRGFEESSGEYICFVDPDDWVAENYVEKLLDNIISTDSDIAVCDCVVCYKNHQTENHFLNDNEEVLEGVEKNKLLYQLVGKTICSYYPPEVAGGVPWGKIFKRSFIENNQLSFIPGMTRMQDNVYCLYAIEAAEKISHISDCLYFYRKEVGSACFKFNPNIINCFEKYFDEALRFLHKYDKEQIMFKALEMKELTSFNSFLTQFFFHKENKKKYSAVKAELKELINNKRYSIALTHIDYSLLNKQEKIFVFALKNRFIALLYVMVKLRSKFKM